jgi:hypothetical protein
MRSFFLAVAATSAVLAGSALAQTGIAPVTTIYRLTPDASFAEGCIPPCLCPVMLSAGVRGTFLLTPSPFTPVGSQVFDVDDVNWTVLGFDGSERWVTGSGTLLRTTSLPGAPPTLRLTLELAFDGGRPVKFDSGPVPDTGSFPKIDLSISSSTFCYGQWFDVVAEPPPLQDVTHYQISGTTIQQGCFPPCLCPLFMEVPAVGTFDLVLLENLGTVFEYAIVNVRWRSRPVLAVQNPITGFGNYTRISGFAGWIEDMDLQLFYAGAPQPPFHGGESIDLDPFPAISLDLSQHGLYCLDTLLRLKAKP